MGETVPLSEAKAHLSELADRVGIDWTRRSWNSWAR